MPAPILTKTELAALENLVRSLKPGPWKAYIEGRDHASGAHFVMTGTPGDRGPDVELYGVGQAEYAFVASMRTMVPRLLATIRHLQSDQSLTAGGTAQPPRRRKRRTGGLDATGGNAMNIATKRVYDPVAADDGFRVLVDRVWPRGMSKEHAHIDLWAKNVAPSTELREWFGHDPAKWMEFQKRYEKELAENAEAVGLLRDAAHARKKMTLLYGAKDEQHNQALVLRDILLEKS